MCLGELGRVARVLPGRHAEVVVAGRTVPVSLITLDADVSTGDWLLVHAGFALELLGADEAEQALALRSHRDPGAPNPGAHQPRTEDSS